MKLTSLFPCALTSDLPPGRALDSYPYNINRLPLYFALVPNKSLLCFQHCEKST